MNDQKKGKFIVLDGVDGAGKSTQIKLIEEFLKSKGLKVLTTLEPGGTKIGQKIREILLNPEFNDMDYIAELLLFNAARAQNINSIIRPAIEKGIYVICDRFSYSTLAYQGFGRGINIEMINIINEISTNGFEPDLTIILDLRVEVGLNRNIKLKKIDRMEIEPIEFYEKIRKGFIEISINEENSFLVDANKSIDNVQFEIQKILIKELNLKDVKKISICFDTNGKILKIFSKREDAISFLENYYYHKFSRGIVNNSQLNKMAEDLTIDYEVLEDFKPKKGD